MRAAQIAEPEREIWPTMILYFALIIEGFWMCFLFLFFSWRKHQFIQYDPEPQYPEHVRRFNAFHRRWVIALDEFHKTVDRRGFDSHNEISPFGSISHGSVRKLRGMHFKSTLTQRRDPRNNFQSSHRYEHFP